MGAMTALIAASTNAGTGLFWGGTALAAIGASLFFSGWISR
jgi:hypothetical protein